MCYFVNRKFMDLFLLSYLWLLTQIVKENVKTGKVARRLVYTEHSVLNGFCQESLSLNFFQ